jgi:formate dehydrogenase major subunit
MHTRNLRPKHDGAEVMRSICPYCDVGCGQLVYHKNGKLISIEGDPGSPISRGGLCLKGADPYELDTHPRRLTRVKYRRPHSRSWEEIDLETAVDMVANRVWESRSEPSRRRRMGSR